MVTEYVREDIPTTAGKKRQLLKNFKFTFAFALYL